MIAQRTAHISIVVLLGCGGSDEPTCLADTAELARVSYEAASVNATATPSGFMIALTDGQFAVTIGTSTIPPAPRGYRTALFRVDANLMVQEHSVFNDTLGGAIWTPLVSVGDAVFSEQRQEQATMSSTLVRLGPGFTEAWRLPTRPSVPFSRSLVASTKTLAHLYRTPAPESKSHVVIVDAMTGAQLHDVELVGDFYAGHLAIDVDDDVLATDGRKMWRIARMAGSVTEVHEFTSENYKATLIEPSEAGFLVVGFGYKFGTLVAFDRAWSQRWMVRFDKEAIATLNILANGDAVMTTSNLDDPEAPVSKLVRVRPDGKVADTRALCDVTRLLAVDAQDRALMVNQDFTDTDFVVVQLGSR